MKDPVTVLESIPGFAGAQVLSQLSGGPTNNSFEVEQGGERFVLRIDKPEAALLGLDRQAEKDICESLASAGLASPPVYFEPESGIYLRGFLPGKTWTGRDLLSAQNLARLARLLRRLHASPLAGKPFDPLQAAIRYADQLGTPGAERVHAELIDRHSEMEKSTQVLCHNDLVAGNILDGEKLMLIDWEYAGIGDPFFDLAVVVQHHRLKDGLAKLFLDRYLQTEASAADLSRLDNKCRFYQSLLDLWHLRVGAPKGPLTTPLPGAS